MSPFLSLSQFKNVSIYVFLDKPAIILTKFSNRILGKEALFFSGGFDGKSGLTTLEVIEILM